MYLQQMLCLMSLWPGDAAWTRAAARRQDLDHLFTALGFVHFACFARVPGADGVAGNDQLLMELALDDGIDPQFAVSTLADRGVDLLWPLFMQAPPPADRDRQRELLGERLVALVATARPAGGFVGMRDRPVSRIVAEWEWFRLARERFTVLRDRALASGGRADAATLACRLEAELAQEPTRAAMYDPPPPSFWCRPRNRVLQMFLALVATTLPVPILLAAVAGVGGAAMWMLRLASWLPEGSGPVVLGAQAAIVITLVVVLVGALLRYGAISATVFLVVMSILGIVVFFLMVVGNGLQSLPPSTWADWPFARVSPAGAAAILAAGFVVVRWLVQLVDNARQRQSLLTLEALVGALLVCSSVGLSALPDSGAVSCGAILAFTILVGAAFWLTLRSAIVRWFFVMSVPVMALLAALMLWGSGGRIDHEHLDYVWTYREAFDRGVLGVLALASAASQVAIVGVLWALAQLRSPVVPLGGPLVLGLLLLGAIALGLGWLDVAWLTHMDYKVPADLPWRASSWLVAAGALAVAAVAILLVAAAVTRLAPAIAERWASLDAAPSDAPLDPAPIPASIRANEAELRTRTNHMISVTDVVGRARGLRWHLAWLFLHVVGQAGHTWYTQGWLGAAWGIKFAHWHFIDGGRRLVFLSNYDGDFGGYLDEFISGASEGINLVWRWTELRQPFNAFGKGGKRKFPGTVGLAFRGCHQEQQFKAYTRASMLPHLYLFQAYSQSSQDIQRATRLRAALVGDRTPANDDIVLRSLES